MLYRKISISLIVFLQLSISLIFFPALSQPIFRHFTKQEGAPEIVTVTKIIQDKQGIMWFATTSGLLKYDSRTFTSYVNEPGNPRSLSNSYVKDILCDKHGDLWIASKGLMRHNRMTDSFTRFLHDPNNENSLSSDLVSCILEDSRGGLWIGTDGGIDYLSFHGDKVDFLRYPLVGKRGGFLTPQCMAEGADGTLWIGTNAGLVQMKKDGTISAIFENERSKTFPAANLIDAIHVDRVHGIWLGIRSGGLWLFDTVAKIFTPVQNFGPKTNSFPQIWKIVADGSNGLWIGTTSGLARFDMSSRSSQWHTNEYGNPNSLGNDAIFSLCVDRQGGVWTGSYEAGIDYFYPTSANFHTLRFSDEKPGNKPFNASWIGRQSNQGLWAASDNLDNVICFNPQANTRRSLPIPFNTSGSYSVFYIDSIGTMWGGGVSLLSRYDPARRKINHYPLRIQGQEQLVKGRILNIYEDHKNRLWVGGDFGLLLFNREVNVFQEAFIGNGNNSPRSVMVNSITEDSKQNLWVGGHVTVGMTAISTLHVLKQGSDGFKQIPMDAPPSPNAPTAIYSIKEDAFGRIWTATFATGLQVYDPKRGRVSRYLKGKKIPIDYAYYIQIDKRGYIWVVGSEGLTRYDPERQTVQNFDQNDGLPSNQIVPEANFQDHDGTLYYGTTKGTFYFNPNEIKVNNREQPIIFSSLKLFNKPVQAGDETGVLSQSLYTAKEIVFRHDQDVFTLDFATLNYIRSDKNKYAYMLEGFEKQWNYVSSPSATYTNLSPGTYTFLVKAANNDGYWTRQPARLKITVLPPWWRTWYAYLAYFLIFAGAIYATARFFWARSLFRKESELYQAKLDFFTNVSHEIRTHLTLIDGPLQKVFQSPSLETTNRNLLSYAKKNSDRLMNLVGELLEFRKMESGEVTLQISEQNLVDNLKNIHSAFEHLFKEKRITTSLEAPRREIRVWYDASQMQKVFYNLLSNAGKFTPEGGIVRVTVEEDDQYAWVNVIDNGKGIDEGHLEKVFQSFFQEYNQDAPNRGYGIGLALSRKIVERHRGLLTVTSKNQAGEQRETRFRIQIPKGNTHLGATEIVKSQMVIPVVELSGLPEVLPAIRHSQSVRKYTVLLIEDNEELRAFTREALENSYKILEAADGLAGINMAREHIPDLIVSDVMMPEMNGLDLCTQLKSDIRTSHIPIVLLTARGATHHMVQGLKAGADAYVLKPFDIRVLELKIKNLIHIRHVLQHRGNPFVSVQPDGLVLAEMDKQFLDKLTALAEQNISDVGFGVSQMAGEVGISVSVLYRKVRALTGLTVNDFVKSIRMQRAKQLLATKGYNVNEVALMVGFENRKYFSKEFQKVYGKLPSKFQSLPTEEADGRL